MVSRILVTSGRGFVGRHLVVALAARNSGPDIIVGVYDGDPQLSVALVSGSPDWLPVGRLCAVAIAIMDFERLCAPRLSPHRP